MRNWKWVVPVTLIGGAAITVGMFASIFAFVIGTIKSSWAFTEGFRLAQQNIAVTAALGEPIESGWFPTGSIHVSGPSGEAELAIPLRGPRGRGTLYVVARKSAGTWDFELAEVKVAGRAERIDLLFENSRRAVLRLPTQRSAPSVLIRPVGAH